MAGQSLGADRFEKFLAFGAALMLSFTIVAVGKGRAEWVHVGPLIWLHLATLATALCVTPILLLRKRGDGRHRFLGWIWAVSMFTTAIISLGIRQIGRGDFSLIHLLSIMVILAVPLLIWRAKTHDIAQHRKTARNMIAGGLLTAGFFTFPFDRLLGHWLFS
jgi:uncharacterized membrane protein